jgi:predicted Rossmann-fold nucleotide-binding protein
MTRVLVTGGRDFTDEAAVFAALDRAHRKQPITCIIHGACHTQVNADKLAGKWAKARGILEEPYPVDHALDGPWPGAGPRRNGRMLRLSHPDGVVAFPGGNGTADMVRRATEASVPAWHPLSKVPA